MQTKKNGSANAAPMKKKEKENTLEVQLMQLPKWEKKKNNPATRFFFFLLQKNVNLTFATTGSPPALKTASSKQLVPKIARQILACKMTPKN